MTPRITEISFIIPAFNEQDAIVETILSVDNVLKNMELQYEIIVVNDGSTDSTTRLLNEQSVDRMELLEHPINAGYGAAIKTGLLHAKYSWIGLIDADGSYDVSAIRPMVQTAQQGFDMVVAKRENIRETDSFFKHIYRRTVEFFIRLVISNKIRDTNSGLRIIRKEALMEFFLFLCSSFSFTTSVTVLFSEKGFFIAYVPSNYNNRPGTSKIKNFRDSIIALLMVIQGITYFNPIKFFFLLVIVFVLFFCMPAMILAWAGMQTLSLYYMLFGIVIALLIAIGVLGDIIRVSGIQGRHTKE